MALSNLRNEPRREITEQVLGTAAVAGFLLADYVGVKWLGAVGAADVAIGMVMGMVVVPIVGSLLFILIVGIHGLGEVLCDVLGNYGVDPRPKQRRSRYGDGW